MAREIKEFDAFGVNYRLTEFSAVRGLQILNMPEQDPSSLLSGMEVQVGENWIALSSRDAINYFVKDEIGVLPSYLVMRGICSISTELNFGFLNDWKGVKIPKRFLSEGTSVSTAYSEPIIAALTANGVATLRELEEYYSMKDAFKQFDILMMKGVNEALASEAASARAASKR